MKTGTWMPAAGAALAGALLAVLAGGWEGGEGTGSLSTPAQQAGAWLRGLSLSGPLGNLAAWLITLLVCALPFLLVVLSRRWNSRGREDWLAGLMVPVLFSAVFSAASGSSTRISAPFFAALVTSGVLLVLALLELVPYLLGALTLLWGARLARSMVPQLFSPQASQLCLRTAEGCRQVVRAGALLSVFSNLLQLVLLGALRSTRFSVSIPLFPLLLAGTLFLLCRLLQRGQELQEDSDSII